MKKIFHKILVSGWLLSLILILSMATASIVMAANDSLINGDEINNNVKTLSDGAGGKALVINPQASIGTVMGLLVKAFIGLLGIIFLILIILAGYNWMTASGDESKVEKAQHTMRYAIIGLAVIIAAYAITYFVFLNLGSIEVSTPSGGGVTGTP